MRTLLLTRGLPGCGKSTWIKQMGLEPYSLSADSLRLLMQSPVTNIAGNVQITQKNDSEVWKLLFKILEDRMDRGEFIVIDATHYKSELLRRYYKLIKDYRYRAYVVDFTDIPLDVCLERNKGRDKYKFVPEEAIKKMSAVFEAEKNSKACQEVGSKFTIVKPDEVSQMLLSEYLLEDISNGYDKMLVFGDIHGCYEPLKNYFEKNPINNSTLYVFTGDFLDRGIQNQEVLRFVAENRDAKNFVLLEGNHEKHLRYYSSKEDSISKIRSREFVRNTIPQLENGVDSRSLKKVVRQICNRLRQFCYYKFGDNKYVISHGGVPCLPNLLMPTNELIKGVGDYELEGIVGENFTRNTNGECIQIHAHRNIYGKDMKYSDTHYNLCDEPEAGKNIRMLEVYKDGNIVEHLLKSTVFKTKKAEDKVMEVIQNNLNISSDIKRLVENMTKNKWIFVKDLGNGINSFNFSRECFRKGIWNNITCKARGLFIDVINGRVMARGYDKFHNIGQTEETKMYSLKKNLVFPCTAYLKENGFLGLVSYDYNNDSLFVASKSSNNSEFSDMVKEELGKLGDDVNQKIKNYCKEHNSTLIFECINVKKDPHIISYNQSHLVLLDIVENSVDSNFAPYDEVCRLGKELGIHYKQRHYIFNNWDEFYNWYEMMSKDFVTPLEGYVIQDANNYRVKYKTNFYLFWKDMRKIKDRMVKDSSIRPAFKSEYEIRVFNFMRGMDTEELKLNSIINVRDKFYNSLDNKEKEKYNIISKN